ncbi:sugar ABC transporter substrate-binding protein [Paenibacillus sp. SYP-B3998]|uniref:Sugar ABC transporter substrate-binding protein n=1 Tax=Paenibacillus sp. SYP-B3998 TaxID=2678564 RepID=A0A6G3ZS03_9BACL|nr:sugar ABC transporter substrate-binding protein [Paenibacillus sp. SYP-B3998]NEW04983.1 sugar ABC transporter substrate-binding protein [Paenibacillus sp. SYP-B3998]
MVKHTKKAVLLTLLTVNMIVVSACSTANTSNQSSAAPTNDAKATAGATGEKVTLTYGGWKLDTITEVIKAFQASHPNIEVKAENTPYKQYFTKLETSAQGGTMPDVLLMNGPNFIKYADNGMLKDITGNIKADQLDLNNFPASLVSLYSLNGKNYGIPKDYDTIGLWYNKKLFDEKGVAYPDASWDWNKLVEAAKKLTDTSKGIYGFAAPMMNQEDYYNTILQAGGNVISDDHKKSGYDQPEAIEGLKFLTDLIQVHKVSPTLAQMTETAPADMFTSGKLAMYFDGSWAAFTINQNQDMKNNADVAVLPKGKKQGVVIHGLGNVISANTKHPKEAWEFVKFLASKEAAEIAAKQGGAIPAYKGSETAWLSAFPQYHAKAFIDMTAYASPYPVSKNTSVWNTYETDILKNAWTGEKSVADAAKELGAKMNQALAAEK